MVKATLAQTTPSVPEFTLRFVDTSYDYYVPPVTTTLTDPYTGNKNVTTQPGYTQYVENKSIEITIKNQPFAPSSGNKYLFYNVRMKGHYGEGWTEIYHEETYITEGSSPQNPSPQRYYSSGNLPQQSNSEYTVLYVSANHPSGAQVDFQVAAITGYDAQAYLGDPDHPLYPVNISYGPVIAINQSSDWSNTQTLTIPDTSTPSPSSTPTLMPSPSLTPSPFIPEFPSWIILPLAMMTVLLAVLELKRRRKF